MLGRWDYQIWCVCTSHGKAAWECMWVTLTYFQGHRGKVCVFIIKMLSAQYFGNKLTWDHQIWCVNTSHGNAAWDCMWVTLTYIKVTEVKRLCTTAVTS